MINAPVIMIAERGADLVRGADLTLDVGPFSRDVIGRTESMIAALEPAADQQAQSDSANAA
jgi:hypothetical protein